MTAIVSAHGQLGKMSRALGYPLQVSLSPSGTGRVVGMGKGAVPPGATDRLGDCQTWAAEAEAADLHVAAG